LSLGLQAAALHMRVAGTKPCSEMLLLDSQP
jgi:hypothetical protein